MLKMFAFAKKVAVGACVVNFKAMQCTIPQPKIKQINQNQTMHKRHILHFKNINAKCLYLISSITTEPFNRFMLLFITKYPQHTAVIICG